MAPPPTPLFPAARQQPRGDQDIHLAVGVPPMLRMYGESLIPVK